MLCETCGRLRRAAPPARVARAPPRILGGELRSALAEPPSATTTDIERLALAALEHHIERRLRSARAASNRGRGPGTVRARKGSRLRSPAPYGQARPDGPRRQPGEASRLRLPVQRDLRRLPVHLGLRAARRAAQAQRQGRLVALDGAAPRRRRRPRRRDPHGPEGLGGERPPRDLHRPARRLPQLQGALPRRPAARVGRVPQLRRQGLVHRGAPVQPDVQDLRRPGRGRRRRSPTCAPRPRRASSSTSRTCRRRRARSRRSASRRSASRSATRSRPGNFIFRTREFEQMEMEYFVPPDDGARWYEYWCQERYRWYIDLGIPEDEPAPPPARPRRAVALLGRHVRRRVHCTRGDGASSRASRNRTDFDLTQHAKFSGQDLSLLRPGERPPVPAVRDRAGCRRRPRHARVPARGLRRGRGAQRQGRHREAHGAAPPPAARADQGRGAAAVEERAARAAWPTRSRRCCARTS